MKDLTRRNFLFGSLAAAGMTLAACNNQGGTATDGGDEGDEGAQRGSDTPLVVGYSHFSSKFSPFFAETVYDRDAAEMTQINLFTYDRQGQDIYHGIQGETREYNGTDYTYHSAGDVEITENADGTVYYDFTIREDMTHSDGEPVTIDDVIFTAYVFCDPTYDGSTTLFAAPIEGMEAYRSGMSSLYSLIVAAGRDNTDFTYFTEEQQTAYWEAADKAAVAIAQEIVDYCKAAGANAEDDPVEACAANWGFELAEGATVEDFGAAMMEQYEGDIATLVSTENAGSSIDDVFPNFSDLSLGVETGQSAPSITGIQRTGDYSMRVVATQVDATLIEKLLLYICPLHHYGSKELYDYDNNSFGFPKGDLSSVRAKTTQPMGPGPYKFIKFDNGVINFEAFDGYFKGAPKIKNLQFREMNDADKLNGLVTGTVDITDPSFSKDTQNAIMQANGGELTGPVITTSTVDNLGYGYIGMNPHNVCVGGEPASDASKNLRRALGTIFAVYRDVAIDSYYGAGASVINYPISNTSWAAPQPTDDDYRLAFSVDASGADIYTSDMDAEAKYEAAAAAALGFFEAAGYTVEDGKLTAAPEGAKLEYEALIPADGSGDHPAFMILTEAKAAFEKLGFNLRVNDLSNSSDLWTKIQAGQHEIWCAAWGATRDPDMYQIYYSDANNPNKATGTSVNPDGGVNQGGSNYHYRITDPELDELIMAGRTSTDQAYRKQIYKAALDKVLDWAVEIPTYQRQNAIVFSTERVNIATVTPDITTFYGWLAEVEMLEMN